MSNNKPIRIMFEFPRKWIDYDSPLLGLGSFLGERLDLLLKEKVVEKLMSEMELPDIQISKEEVKDRMLTILAERALEKDNV